MLLLPLLAYLGWVRPAPAAFHPLGAVLGGYLFGLAMSWAAGCAGGVWYKAGAGNWRAAIAIFGLALGAFSTELGGLSRVRSLVQGVGSDDLRSATVGGLIGFDGIVFVIAPLILLLLFRSKRAAPANAWSWTKTGALMGALATLAWMSSHLAGRSFGMAIIPGSVEAMGAIVFPARSAPSWDLIFVLFIPAGAWIATRNAARSSSDLGAKAALKLFAGGVVLGVSASLAGGCTVGHSLVGLPLLSIGSIVTTVFIILGTWTVGWLEMKKQRPT
jgi:uncharacterized membrane protein YedE/YeeE